MSKLQKIVGGIVAVVGSLILLPLILKFGTPGRPLGFGQGIVVIIASYIFFAISAAMGSAIEKKQAKTRLKMSIQKCIIPVSACLLLMATLVYGESGDLVTPPKTGKYDKEAMQIAAGTKSKIEIPEGNPVIYDGIEETMGGSFVPKKGNFRVKSGQLKSGIGPLEKSADFTSWEYIYKDSTKKEIIGWGPCVTGGEVLVSNIFIKSVPADRYVENIFEAEDYGNDCTLIKLDPAKGHKLCLFLDLRLPYSVNGLEKSVMDGKLSGRCAEDKSPDDILISTAGYIGTKAEIQGVLYERKSKGWIKK